MSFRIRGVSSRYNRGLAVFLADARKQLNACDVAWFTEVSSDARATALKRLATELGFGMAYGNKGGNDDCAVLWRKTRFRGVIGATVAIESPRSGDDPDAAIVVLDDLKEHKRVLISAFHMPHGVEIAGRFRPGKMTARWKTERANWTRTVNEWMTVHKCHAAIMGGDWNINLRSPFFQKHIRAGMPNWRLPRNIPAKGSHRKRLIDFAVSRGGSLAGFQVLPKGPASDHCPISMSFTYGATTMSAPPTKETKVATTQNLWQALPGDSKKLHIWNIPTKHGNVRIKMRNGSVGFILAWCVLRWAELLEPVKGKILDDWGYAYRPVRGVTSGLSNHASGTAVDVNATRWPLGTRNMSAWKRARVALVIRPVRGVVTWGGVWRRPDQMHLEITKGTMMSACEKVAKRLMTTPRGKRILKANPGQKKVIES